MLKIDAQKKPRVGEGADTGGGEGAFLWVFRAETLGRTQLPSANRPVVDNVPESRSDSQSFQSDRFQLANSRPVGIL